MSLKIDLSRIHYPVTRLGPGSRVAIWFQGCSIRCAGCCSQDTWKAGRGTTTVDDVLYTIRGWLSEADGLTITGGEPFDQPAALGALLAGARRSFAGDVLVYTGYPRTAISSTLAELDGSIDVLVSDPYDPPAGQSLSLRGSNNQQMHLLTSLGRSRFGQLVSAPTADRAVDLFVDSDGTAWMAGIPRPGDLRKLQRLLALAGVVSGSTESAIDD